MDLKSSIHPEFWNAISKAYVSESYKAAILEGMNYLSRAIREKTGLDGDGTQLANGTFGGNPDRTMAGQLGHPRDFLTTLDCATPNSC